MKKSILGMLFIAISAVVSAQVIKTTSTEITFFSETPVENIKAINKKATGAINTDSKAIAFSVPIKSFIFEKSLMQEHFNENYMESTKYPLASFKGKINEAVDFKKDGSYKVSATGKLNIHGVERDRTIDGTLVIKSGTATLVTAFKVKLVDHKIDRPSILMQNIAEDIDVKMNAQFKTN